MLGILKRLTKRDIIYLLISIVFIVFQVFLDLKLPDYMSNITTLVQTEGSSMQDILVQGSYMLLCAMGSLISAIITGYFAASIASHLGKTLRKAVFNKVENFGMEEIKLFSTSSLITRTTNDVTQIQMLIAMGMQLLIKAPITAIWAITKIAGKSFEWSIITFGAVVVLIILNVVLILIAVPKFRIVQRLTDNLNRITRENLIGIRVVRAYNAEGYQQNKFDNANNELTGVNAFAQKLMALLNPSMQFIMATLTLLIYFVGAILIQNAVIDTRISLFSDMVVFSSYAMQVVMAFMMLALIFIIYPRANVSAKRIIEVLDTNINIKDGPLDNPKTEEEGTVEFKNVSFKYPDAEEYMLHNVSFKANKGDTVAFIGSTGSGKSTLINLIPRFYDATEGEVLVDNINVKEYKQETLYNKLGYIPQKPIMFSGTVNENVSYGNNGKGKPSDKKIKEAIKIAQGTEFVEKMPKKYNAHIAQGGTNISGGQKQRLSIARAIVRDPEIYIFDDSFSALDYKTDSNLRKDLKKYTKGATTLIVAQRIGTIKDADKIIVLDNGKVVGDGTHKELLKKCKVYKEIALSQLSKEELENA